MISVLPQVPGILAYRPFLDPIPMDAWWLLLLPPLVLAIAIVWKTVKLDDLRKVPREAVFLTVQILAFMVIAAATLWVMAEVRARVF